MRILLICLLFSFSAYSGYKKELKLAEHLIKKDLPFTAITLLKNALRGAPGTLSKSKYEKYYYQALLKVGAIPFLDLDERSLRKMSRRFYAFILGKKYFEKKNFPLAIKYFKKVKKGEYYYPHARYHLGGIYLLQNNYRKAYAYYIQTHRLAAKAKKKYKESDYRYIALDFIQDSAFISLGRVLYKKGDLVGAAKVFKKVPVDSYLYPESLFESSWNFFRAKHYEQSIGKLLTFQAPFMKNYFYSEAEIIKGLVFIKLCRWKDLLDLVKAYRANLKKPALGFVNFLRNSKKKEKYVRLMIDDNFKESLKDNFLLRLINVINHKPSYIALKRVFGEFSSEYKLIKKRKRKYGKKLYRVMSKSMAISLKIYRDFISNYIRRKFISLGQDIVRLDMTMTEMELFVISKVKSDIYNKTDTLTKRKNVINLEELSKKEQQYYFDFVGEFWADEIGSYLPLLKSKCVQKGKS